MQQRLKVRWSRTDEKPVIVRTEVPPKRLVRRWAIRLGIGHDRFPLNAGHNFIFSRYSFQIGSPGIKMMA